MGHFPIISVPLAEYVLTCSLCLASLCSLSCSESSALALAWHSLSCSLCLASLCSLCSGVSSALALNCSTFSVFFPMSCQLLLSLFRCFLHSSSSSTFSLLLPKPCYPLLLSFFVAHPLFLWSSIPVRSTCSECTCAPCMIVTNPSVYCHVASTV